MSLIAQHGEVVEMKFPRKNKYTGYADFPSFETRVGVACALAARDINSFHNSDDQNGYVRDSYPCGETAIKKIDLPDGYTGMFCGEPYVFANRELIRYYFGMSSFNRYDDKEDTIIPKINMTEELLAKADEVISFLQQKYMFDSFGDNLNNYTTEIYKLLSNGTANIQNCGLLASIPGAYDREVKNQNDYDVISKLMMTCDYVGGIGDNITVEVQIIKSIYLRDYGCYVYTAHDGKNIFSFTTRKIASEFGQRCEIKGKVKSHKRNKFLYNAKCTQLNYVKCVKIIEERE